MGVCVVLISAGAEWRVARALFPDASARTTPYGEWFATPVGEWRAVFVQGGWGKISAAASAQYALDRWQPHLVANLGTCGGFAGCIERGEIVLVERTLVYDLIEQMNPDPDMAIRHYSTALDLGWLRSPYPQQVRRGLLVSADRDIWPPDIPRLKERYGAVAADWESGAIAWVVARNGVACLILRGVSDLVSEAEGGEAYDAIEVFNEGARRVMEPLLHARPAWRARVDLSAVAT